MNRIDTYTKMLQHSLSYAGQALPEAPPYPRWAHFHDDLCHISQITMFQDQFYMLQARHTTDLVFILRRATDVGWAHLAYHFHEGDTAHDEQQLHYVQEHLPEYLMLLAL